MFEQTFKNIDEVLWKEAGCTTELDYTEQTSWILFLKYLDNLEHAMFMNTTVARLTKNICAIVAIGQCA
jgi:type I restriction enzyme M protein